MIKILESIKKLIDQINETAGRLVSWLNVVLVVLVCFDVVTRYLFSETQAWIMELEWHLFALVFLIGSGYAFKHDRHVRVDLFYDKFSPKNKALVNIVGNLLFLIPWCVLIIIFSVQYAKISFQIGETSPDPGGLPARYVIKASIAFGIFLLFLQAVANLMENLLIYFGYQAPSDEEEDLLNVKLKNE